MNERSPSLMVAYHAAFQFICLSWQRWFSMDLCNKSPPLSLCVSFFLSLLGCLLALLLIWKKLISGFTRAVVPNLWRLEPLYISVEESVATTPPGSTKKMFTYLGVEPSPPQVCGELVSPSESIPELQMAS